MAAIVTVVLLLAIINYINLSIAQGAMRSKEISVKKLLGQNAHFVLRSTMLVIGMDLFLYCDMDLNIEAFHSKYVILNQNQV